MPSPLRLIALSATAGLLATLGACGDGSADKNVAAPMQNMEAVDGSVNDAMTDLDGVQSEGTALAEVAGNNTAHDNAAKGNQSDEAEGAKSEAVAAQ
jgi:hypothetical protein